MAYGEDRDPYGAQMPYRIPYETYNPNFPSIPGVANSFAPGAYGNQYDYYGTGAPAGTMQAGGGSGPRGGMPDYARQEVMFVGRGNEDFGQLALRGNDTDETSTSDAMDGPGAAARRHSVLPPPIGTRRASQVDGFDPSANQQRQRQPQFPSPFRNPDSEHRYNGRDGMYHAAPTHANGNGNGYRVAPNTTVFAGSPLTEQAPGSQYYLG